jgi:hypothetical protein
MISLLWLASEWAPGRLGSAELGELRLTSFGRYLLPWPDPVHSAWFMGATLGLLSRLVIRMRRGGRRERLAAVLGLLVVGGLAVESVRGFQEQVQAPVERVVSVPSDGTVALRVERQPAPDRIWVSLRVPPDVAVTRELGRGEWLRTAGWDVRFLGESGEGPERYAIRVRDRRADPAQSSETYVLKLDEPVALDGGKSEFRVTEYARAVERFGEGARIRYGEPGGLKPERFWIFQRYPGFNAASRPHSRYVFELVRAVPGRAPVLTVRRSPAVRWIAVTGVLWLGALVWVRWGARRDAIRVRMKGEGMGDAG